MVTLTRQQLLDTESETVAALVDTLPGELQDQVLSLLAGLVEGDEIQIPAEYVQGVIDNF